VSDFSLPQLLPPVEAAKLISKSPQSLANDRAQGRGLPYHKLGAKVLYSVTDIVAAIEKGRVVPNGL